MILGVLGLLGAIFSVTSGLVDVANYAHEHPWRFLAVGSDEWKQQCKIHFKSFDPDTGDWWDGRQWRPCVIQIKRHW